MITFVCCLIALIVGYFIYGKFIERIFGIDAKRQTPAYTHQDGVDYIPMPTWKVFMIQFLNIAGLGPIFGAIMGAKFGTASFLWIVLGSIFAGSVHDYLSGMLSLRHNGESLPEIIGRYLGVNFKQFMRGFTVILMVLVGSVFVAGPAGLLAKLTPEHLDTTFWIIVVFLYYILATLLPVDKIIGKIYPLFAAALLFMAIGILVMLFVNHPPLPEITDGMPNTYPGHLPIFPIMFVSIACGAISGFHSLVSSGTTSKQLDKETDAKPIAYGGMLLECVLAVITLVAIAYARQTGHTAGATDIFAGGVAGMASQIAGGNQSLFNILYTLLVLTYSAFCLTSLDTATRLARFMFQEFWIDGTKGETPENVTGLKKVMANPYIATGITVVLGILLGLNGYAKIWALFGSANQLLAALGLLAVATWLGNVGKDNKMFLIPMAFMLCVTIASLLINSWQQFNVILAGGADWGPYVQVILGLMLVILAVVLAIEGVTTIAKQRKAAKA